MLAPICLFTYNRLKETQQTIAALQQNDLAAQSELLIFSDGPKNENVRPSVAEVREFLKTISGFQSVQIMESPENKGLANSIISGVTQVIKQYGKIIVIEDDLITTPNFLHFMNEALDFYKSDKTIQSINGFTPHIKKNKEDVYFQIRPFSWGWATWGDRWDKEIFDKKKICVEIDSDKTILTNLKKTCGDDIPKMLMDSLQQKNNSWYVRWVYDHFKNQKYSVYPSSSFISNIGFGENSTHCKGINSYVSQSVDIEKTEFKFKDFDFPDSSISKEFLKNFSFINKLKLRVQLLGSKTGRNELLSELKIRIH
ncbi:glycosyltransferase [Prolixibacter sp. NT017]|uniref:glycosyltransferase n=1 Tax=Prolixibacter sp. NT017 TaxID=2652390 RepID=UPI001270D433|nr:glycosyltransferase [Prolixibacter sp. NT017]GET24467.1 glycosyl transferase [Prolixibacter sp. NT017]